MPAPVHQKCRKIKWLLVQAGWGKDFVKCSTGSWAELQLPCCPSKQGELSENILQNHFLNLPPKTSSNLGVWNWPYIHLCQNSIAIVFLNREYGGQRVKSKSMGEVDDGIGISHRIFKCQNSSTQNIATRKMPSICQFCRTLDKRFDTIKCSEKCSGTPSVLTSILKR